jgi:glycosyltransferase involved in cell wall biosynthesis
LLIRLFEELGWKVDFFHPLSSRSGLLESYLRRPHKPDLLWSPCFRQTDIASAAHWADRWRLPLIIDPLISAYQKDVFERCKWPLGSPQALRRKKWESSLFARADIVIADTPAHADYFRDNLEIDSKKLRILHVSAEESLFTPAPFPPVKEYIEVFFYGSFLPLQGIDTIVDAANATEDPRIRWTILGEGDLLPQIKKRAAGNPRIAFEPWLKYIALPERLSRAHILLGVFGTTPKAGLVIPNKVFQAMASGRPLITRSAEAYRGTLADSEVIGWVPPGDPAALSHLVRQWSADSSKLKQRGLETRELFEIFFGHEKTRSVLNELVEQALTKASRIRR